MKLIDFEVLKIFRKNTVEFIIRPNINVLGIMFCEHYFIKLMAFASHTKSAKTRLILYGTRNKTSVKHVDTMDSKSNLKICVSISLYFNVNCN